MLSRAACLAHPGTEVHRPGPRVPRERGLHVVKARPAPRCPRRAHFRAPEVSRMTQRVPVPSQPEREVARGRGGRCPLSPSCCPCPGEKAPLLRGPDLHWAGHPAFPSVSRATGFSGLSQEFWVGTSLRGLGQCPTGESPGGGGRPPAFGAQPCTGWGGVALPGSPTPFLLQVKPKGHPSPRPRAVRAQGPSPFCSAPAG